MTFTVTEAETIVVVEAAEPAIAVVVTEPSVMVVEVGTGLGPTGPPGPPGPQGQWESMTQAEYDALPTYDPDVLYVIIG